jgi:tight adherence protein B
VGGLLGLMLGCGVLLIWRSGPRAPQRRAAVASRWMVRRTDLLRQAGVDGVGTTQLLAVQVLCALVGGVIVVAMTSTLAVAVCFATFGFFGPVLVLVRMRRRRQVALRELWPEAVDNLASAVRAGLSLPEGLSALALRGPEPLRAPFTRFSAAYRASGRFGECLDALKDDLADPVGDRVCETMRVAVRSAAVIWARCCERCPSCCAPMRGPARSWRPARVGGQQHAATCTAVFAEPKQRPSSPGYGVLAIVSE